MEPHYPRVAHAAVLVGTAVLIVSIIAEKGGAAAGPIMPSVGPLPLCCTAQHGPRLALPQLTSTVEVPRRILTKGVGSTAVDVMFATSCYERVLDTGRKDAEELSSSLFRDVQIVDSPPEVDIRLSLSECV